MTSNVTTIEYGDPHEYGRFLVIEGEAINTFLRRPTAHPNTVLVVANRTPNDTVYTDRFQNAEPVLDGGFEGFFMGEFPKEFMTEDSNHNIYRQLGLQNEQQDSFKEAFNTWLETERSSS